MSALAVLLIAIGIGDVCRRMVDPWWPAPVAAVVSVVACLLLGGLWHLGDVLPLAITAAASVAWLLLCDRAERLGEHQGMPLAVLGAAATTLILSSGWGSDMGGVVERWLRWVGYTASADRVTMVVGVALAQLATANQVVRLILGSVGAVKPVGQPQPSDRLRGGRLLGPMERVLIVGLGLAGQLTMATAVVAAKSVIRFPEINAQRSREKGEPGVGIDDVTEYFLVGSFASWILAFGGLALVATV